MEQGQDRQLQLTSVKIIFHIQGWVIFMFFEGILILFHYSSIYELKLEAAEVG